MYTTARHLVRVMEENDDTYRLKSNSKLLIIRSLDLVSHESHIDIMSYMSSQSFMREPLACLYEIMNAIWHNFRFMQIQCP